MRKTSAARRFPPPWSAEELDAYFVVRDHRSCSKMNGWIA
jgi:hypothetical protein